MSSKKISAFTSQTSYQNGDQINVVRNNTNFKIDASNLAAYLGTTGSIQPVGNGVPVLEQCIPTNNNIRDLEDGNGIQMSLSATNGILVNHNFVNGSPGVGIIQDITSKQTLIRSCVAGSGINIVAVDFTASILSSKHELYVSIL